MKRTAEVPVICFVLVTSFAATGIWNSQTNKIFLPCTYKREVSMQREKLKTFCGKTNHALENMLF